MLRFVHRVILCASLAMLGGCIGAPFRTSSLHNYGGGDKAQYGNAETDRLYDCIFIGMTRDQLIMLYGPPNRTAKLENGTRLMQYNRKTTDIDFHGHRSRSSCALRLWLRDNIVTNVDYRGDQDACSAFAGDARGDVTHDHHIRK